MIGRNITINYGDKEADDKKANDEKDKTTTADSKDDKQKDSDGAIRGKKLK